jgi:hypothetical protein
VSIIGKFCTSCGTALNEGAKFCRKCGANASPIPEEATVLPDQATPNRETVLSKAGKKVKNEAKVKAVDYAKSIFPLPMLAQIVVNKGTLQGLKGGISQLTGIVKDGKKALASLLFGAGAGLIACNHMGSSNLENTMLCLAGFLLSAKALTHNGFLRRLINALK